MQESRMDPHTDQEGMTQKSLGVESPQEHVKHLLQKTQKLRTWNDDLHSWHPHTERCFQPQSSILLRAESASGTATEHRPFSVPSSGLPWFSLFPQDNVDDVLDVGLHGVDGQQPERNTQEQAAKTEKKGKSDKQDDYVPFDEALRAAREREVLTQKARDAQRKLEMLRTVAAMRKRLQCEEAPSPLRTESSSGAVVDVNVDVVLGEFDGQEGTSAVRSLTSAELSLKLMASPPSSSCCQVPETVRTEDEEREDNLKHQRDLGGGSVGMGLDDYDESDQEAPGESDDDAPGTPPAPAILGTNSPLEMASSPLQSTSVDVKSHYNRASGDAETATESMLASAAVETRAPVALVRGVGTNSGSPGLPGVSVDRDEELEQGGKGSAGLEWQALLRKRFSDHSVRRDQEQSSEGAGAGANDRDGAASHVMQQLAAPSRAWCQQEWAGVQGCGAERDGTAARMAGAASTEQTEQDSVSVVSDWSLAALSLSSAARREARQDEIDGFASYLGMDKDEDKHLLWIAEAAVLSPVPQGWQQHETEDGYSYFHSVDTGETSWEHPTDVHFKNLFRRIKDQEQASLKAAEIAVLSLRGAAHATGGRGADRTQGGEEAENDATESGREEVGGTNGGAVLSDVARAVSSGAGDGRNKSCNKKLLALLPCSRDARPEIDLELPASHQPLAATQGAVEAPVQPASSSSAASESDSPVSVALQESDRVHRIIQSPGDPDQHDQQLQALMNQVVALDDQVQRLSTREQPSCACCCLS